MVKPFRCCTARIDQAVEVSFTLGLHQNGSNVTRVHQVAAVIVGVEQDWGTDARRSRGGATSEPHTELRV